MIRTTAYKILTKYLSNPVLLAHCLAVEAIMRSLAKRLKQDPEEWGIAGLLHDADYQQAKGDPTKHGLLLFELEPNSIPSVIEQAIKAHNFDDNNVKPEFLMDWALYITDELASFIQQIALTTKHKTLKEVTPELVVEKLQQKDFLKEVSRQKIQLCEERLGIPQEEFIQQTIQSLQNIS